MLNLTTKEGGYTDLTALTDFYALFRGIFNAFWEALKGIIKAINPDFDLDEGKTSTEAAE